MNTFTGLAKFNFPLPLYVDGGETKWRIYEATFTYGSEWYFGVVAHCITNGQTVTLTHGHGVAFNKLHFGFHVSPNSMAGKIVRKMIKDGLAEPV